MQSLKKAFLATCFASTLAVSLITPAMADYPEEDIRYVLHVSPGGSTDVLARKLVPGLQEELGVNIVVENRPGGQTAMQMADLTRSDPDGYTLGSVTATHISKMHLLFKDRYDVDSVDWIARLVVDPYLITVNSDSPFQNLQALDDHIAQNPGEITVAGFANGSGSHVAWEIFAESAGIESQDIKWVPYESVKDAVTAVLGGHADLTVANVGMVRGQVQAGNLRVLGIMADERADLLPEVPTFKEAGYDVDTSWQQFRGIIGPKGMPMERKQKLAAAIKKVMETQEFQDYLTSAQLNYGFMPPKEFAQFANQQDQATQAWLERLGLMK